MAAWITKEWRDDAGKLKREKTHEELKGVRLNDRFVVEWTPSGKPRKRQKIEGYGRPAKALAIELCQQIRAQLTLGTYGDKRQATWSDFRDSFEKRHLAPMHAPSAKVIGRSLDLFERLESPQLVADVDAERVAGYLAKLRQEPGRKPGSKMRVETIRKHGACLKLALKLAVEWGYLDAAPIVKLPKAPKEKPQPMPLETFAKIYAACDSARHPKDCGIPAPDWWRALLVLLSTTGLRIAEALELTWADVNLDDGIAMLAGADTKGRRYATIYLLPTAIEHLSKIRQLSRPEVFPWNGSERLLWESFWAIQRAAGVSRPTKDAAQDAEAFWGFHSVRKQFLTVNASRLSSAELMAVARHSSIATTLKYYVDAESGAKAAAGRLHVPELPEVQRA